MINASRVLKSVHLHQITPESMSAAQIAARPEVSKKRHRLFKWIHNRLLFKHDCISYPKRCISVLNC